MKAPPTTGLSAIVSGGGSDQDECVCTYSCEGVHLHQMREYKEEREEGRRLEMEQALEIKYCPGIVMELPEYKYIEYKPRGSKDKPKLFQGFSVGGNEGGKSDSSLRPDISSSEQSQQIINEKLDMNFSTKPTILKILEKLKAGGMNTSTLPRPRKLVRKQLNLCVSRDMAGGMKGGTLLVGQQTNQKRARESDGHYLIWGQTKKLKVSAE